MTAMGPTGPPGGSFGGSIGPTGPSAPIAQQNSVPAIEPDPSHIAEMAKVRLSEMETLCRRLGRISKWRWERLWFSAGLLLIGSALGGVYAVVGAPTPAPARSQACTGWWL